MLCLCTREFAAVRADGAHEVVLVRVRNDRHEEQAEPRRGGDPAVRGLVVAPRAGHRHDGASIFAAAPPEPENDHSVPPSTGQATTKTGEAADYRRVMDAHAAVANAYKWFAVNSGWGPPHGDSLPEWVADGVCRCPDNCIVGPAEWCEHGLASWWLIMLALA